MVTSSKKTTFFVDSQRLTMYLENEYVYIYIYICEYYDLLLSLIVICINLVNYCY